MTSALIDPRMQASGERGSVEHTPGGSRAPWLALLTVMLGCAGGTQTPDPEAFWDATREAQAETLSRALAEEGAPLGEGTLRIRIAFGGGADLDLYVSDPLQETVYYANNPSASGGRLDADRRCGDAAPRIEQVEVPTAAAGRYRIGVDYPAACDGRGRPEVFVLEVRHGGMRRVHRAAVTPARFLPEVATLELGPDLGQDAPP